MKTQADYPAQSNAYTNESTVKSIDTKAETEISPDDSGLIKAETKKHDKHHLKKEKIKKSAIRVYISIGPLDIGFERLYESLIALEEKEDRLRLVKRLLLCILIKQQSSFLFENGVKTKSSKDHSVPLALGFSRRDVGLEALYEKLLTIDDPVRRGYYIRQMLHAECTKIDIGRVSNIAKVPKSDFHAAIAIDGVSRESTQRIMHENEGSKENDIETKKEPNIDLNIIAKRKAKSPFS